MHIDNLDDYAASLTSDCAKVAYLKGYEKGLAKGKELAVKHGHWVQRNSVGSATCSICNGLVFNYYDNENHNYCPKCGAKMDEK